MTYTHYIIVSWSYFIGLPKEGVVGTSLVDDITDEMLLAIVGGKYADALGGISQQTHVHVQSHRVLSFSQIL